MGRPKAAGFLATIVAPKVAARPLGGPGFFRELWTRLSASYRQFSAVSRVLPSDGGPSLPHARFGPL
jgi:hypothetical protein